MTIKRPNFAFERVSGLFARTHDGWRGRRFAKAFRRFAKAFRPAPAVRLVFFELMLGFKPMKFNRTERTVTGWPEEKLRGLSA